MKPITILLIIIIICLWFAPVATKGIIKATGKVALDTTKTITTELKNNPEIKNATIEIKETVANKLKNITNKEGK